MPTPFGYVSQLLRRWLLKAITERISKYENENDVKTQAPTAQGEPLSTCAGRLPPTKQQNQSPHNRLAACNVRLASMHSKNKESARISLKCPWSACVIHDYFRVRTFNASSPPHQQPNYQPLACIFIDIKKQKKDSWLPFTIMLPYSVVENSLSKAPLQKASARNQGSPSAAGRYANFAIPATQRSPARATTVLLRIWNIQKCLQNCPSCPEQTEKWSLVGLWEVHDHSFSVIV